MRSRESEEYTERPIVKQSRENMEERGMKKHPSETKSEGKSSKRGKTNFTGGLASEGDIIQKGKESYKSRYSGSLSPKSEIVQEKAADFKNNRYK